MDFERLQTDVLVIGGGAAGCRAAIKGDLSALYLPHGRHFFLALSLPHQLATAMLIAEAASMRRESRGPHYRTDFPSPDDVHLPIVANQEGGQLQYRFRSLK